MKKVFLDNNLFIYKNHIWNLQEDFKVRFKDLLNREIPELVISLFDVEMESEYWDTYLKKIWNYFRSWSEVYVHI